MQITKDKLIPKMAEIMERELKHFFRSHPGCRRCYTSYLILAKTIYDNMKPVVFAQDMKNIYFLFNKTKILNMPHVRIESIPIEALESLKTSRLSEEIKLF